MSVKPILFILACQLILLCGDINPARSETLSIQQMDIAFKDGSRIASAELNSKLQAIASLTLKGTGPFSGAWEVASPPSTSGTTVYKKIKLFQTMTAGSRQVELESPLLPTDQPGLYLLRLQCDRPRLAQPPKPLRYQVSGR